MKLNENISYAKSILLKNGITLDTPEYKDYLKIREICGEHHGYVGILTKIRFVDGITDLDEIKSIFEVLKNSKMDIFKLNKLSYNDILEMFYDDLSGEKTKNEDMELVFRDSQYLYYKVYTYKGILKIGSPAWCLKTKKYWDEYQSKYGQQWVVIDSRHKNRLITPDNNYLTEYKPKLGWVRYGVSIKHNDDNTFSWVGFSDNNTTQKYMPSSYTFYGVLSTILNLEGGIKKSYYDSYPWCEKYKDSKAWHKVIDQKMICKRFLLGENYFKEGSDVYVSFSETYSFPPIFLILNDSVPHGFITGSDDSLFADISGKYGKMITEEYALKSEDILYSGIKLKLGKITISDIEKDERFIQKIGKWILFDRNDNYYLLVNIEMDTYQVPEDRITSPGKSETFYRANNPMYFYLDKKTKVSYWKDINFEGMKDIIDEISKIEKAKEPDPDKKVKGFWDFLKKNK